MNDTKTTCKQCQKEFIIHPEDKAFYQRIDAPLPVYCPNCRMQRRLAHRNERTLYRRTCDKCKKDIVSIYPAGTAWPVYCHECWWGDTWDAKDFALDYDPQKSFFHQLKELASRVPRVGLLSITSVNSEYTNNSGDNKNCYMLFAAEQNEDSLYGRLLQRCRSVVDGLFMYDSELCYECVDCRRCYSSLYSERCQGSSDLLFCFNVRDSQNCILSTNLRHKSYYIENKQSNKEEYEKRKKQILSSYQTIEETKKRFEELRSNALVKYAFQTKCVNASGDYLFNCHDTMRAWDAEHTKSCGYLADIAGAIDCYDGNNMYYTPELCFDMMGIIKCYGSRHSKYVFYCTDVQYCDSMYHSEHCFGCIGFKKSGKYCILNKEYSKEKYELTVQAIIASMKKEGIYGSFLPPSLSPFGYNETLAKDYVPLSKEDALRQGFLWQNVQSGIFGKETIKPTAMPASIEEVTDNILKEVFACEACGLNFRIIKPELDFYRTMHLPLPHRDFECRHKERMAARTPRELWHRVCQCQGETDNKQPTTNSYRNTATHFHGKGLCPNTFETSYSPERKEIVYCEKCYLAEVA